MPHEIDTAKLAAAILDKRKKEDLGVRGAADEIGGVSASTLSRVEKGNLPDLDTYLRLCRWLSRDPKDFTIGEVEESRAERDVADDLIIQLRADRTLDERTKEALVTMIRTAYAAAQRGEIEDEALHD